MYLIRSVLDIKMTFNLICCVIELFTSRVNQYWLRLLIKYPQQNTYEKNTSNILSKYLFKLGQIFVDIFWRQKCEMEHSNLTKCFSFVVANAV